MKRFRSDWLPRLFENNTFVKIISVVIALISWFVVAVIIDQSAEVTVYNVPIHVQEEGTSLQELGLSVVEGDSQTANIRVQGKRYQIGALSPEDFNVTAYPASVTAPGEYNLKVTVLKADNSKDFEILSSSVSEITVRFDRVVAKTFDVSAEAPNVKAAPGYIMGDPVATASPRLITITGPEQTIEKISECVVRTNATAELSSTFVTEGAFEILDEAGQVLDPVENRFNVSAKEFSVSIPILKQKMLPLKFDYINMPSGLREGDIPYDLSNEYIQVAAPVELIDSLSELKIGYVDFKQLDLNYTQEFELELPAGYKNFANLTKVTVTFDTSELIAKYLWINRSNIKAVNVPSGYEVSVVTGSINSVKVLGKEDDVVSLSYADLVGEVDLTNISEEGQYTVPVNVKFPTKNSVWAVGEYTAVVSVRKS